MFLITEFIKENVYTLMCFKSNYLLEQNRLKDKK